MTTQVLPANFPGSLPEYLVVRALEKLGKIEGVDYSYQAPFMGGRLDKGGMIIDFLFFDPPDLAINVQGEYWHYGFGSEIKARDIIAREQLAGLGITLIFIDENDVLENADFYVREALQYIDHSKLARG